MALSAASTAATQIMFAVRATRLTCVTQIVGTLSKIAKLVAVVALGVPVLSLFQCLPVRRQHQLFHHTFPSVVFGLPAMVISAARVQTILI